MDYEKAYIEALERAKVWQNHLYDTNDKDYADELNYIFTELSESEDELTWLTKYIEEEAYSLSMDIRDNEDRIKHEKLQKALAWLEKQKEPELSEDLGEYIAELSKQFPEVSFAKLSRIAVRVKNWLEKQGQKKCIDDLTQQEAMDIAVAKCFEQGEQKVSYTTLVETGNGGINALVTKELPTNGCDDEQKPSDMVEPKFKVGDKIRRKIPRIYDKDMQVARIGKDYYLCNNLGKFSSEQISFSEESNYELVEHEPACSDKKKLTDVNHEYFSELLENNDSKDIDDYASQCAYCMSHDWMKDTATWDDVEKACKLGAKWYEEHHKSTWSEEDKDFMYDTLSNLAELKGRYGEGYGNVGKCIDWLKSLKDRIGG